MDKGKVMNRNEWNKVFARATPAQKKLSRILTKRRKKEKVAADRLDAQERKQKHEQLMQSQIEKKEQKRLAREANQHI